MQIQRGKFNIYVTDTRALDYSLNMYMRRSRPYYEYKSSCWPPAEIIMVVIVVRDRNYNYDYNC